MTGLVERIASQKLEIFFTNYNFFVLFALLDLIV